MVFSSIEFLFFFLPVVLLCVLIPHRYLQSILLTILSLFFYAWGEGTYVLVMIGSIFFNWLTALLIAQQERHRRAWLAICVVGNLGALGYFKYAGFFTENVNWLLSAFGISPIPIPAVVLPIGISFFTFQAMSYVIDVYRRDVAVQKDPIKVGLYVSLFPQLIAGHIVRYIDVAAEINNRTVRLDNVYIGMNRFLVGLAKKVLIANKMGEVADAVFALPPESLNGYAAWVGTLCYTLQIYFDFSAYSDMAIGLGLFFGFHFLENFNFPYKALSITDFWRRWHISLSTWFRDYVYIPLGGNRGGEARTYRNLLIVFFLCGLWHGAKWTFIFWGAFHGLLLIAERMGLGRRVSGWWRPLQHFYVLLVVIIGWVFFRADTLTIAGQTLKAMAFLSPALSTPTSIHMVFGPEAKVVLLLGMIFALDLPRQFSTWASSKTRPQRTSVAGFGTRYVLPTVFQAYLFFLFLLCVMKLAVGTYNPFIYFRF